MRGSSVTSRLANDIVAFSKNDFFPDYFLPMHQSLFELVVKCLGTMVVSLSYEELISFFCFILDY